MKPKKLVPNPGKIVAALAYLIGLANNRGLHASQYDLVKSLFLADRSHLNAWGRPITFDNYFAMKHGPVPTTAYNILKQDSRTLKQHAIENLPWLREDVGRGQFTFTIVQDFDVEDELSKSDMQALDWALTTIKRLSFGQIRRLTHEDPAYVDAWRDEGPENSSYPMRFDLLFDDPSPETADTLLEYSPYVSTG